MDGQPLDDEKLEAAHAEAQRLEKDRRRQLGTDVRNVMSHPAGRRVVWWLIDELTGTFGGSFVGEAHATAFNEGKRSVGISLMQHAQRLAGPDYVHMLREALDARNAEPAVLAQEDV